MISNGLHAVPECGNKKKRRKEEEGRRTLLLDYSGENPRIHVDLPLFRVNNGVECRVVSLSAKTH